jgi:hypothetical protein
MFPASENHGEIRVHSLNIIDRLVHCGGFNDFSTAKPSRCLLGSALRATADPIFAPKGFFAARNDSDFEFAHFGLHDARQLNIDLA